MKRRNLLIALLCAAVSLSLTAWTVTALADYDKTSIDSYCPEGMTEVSLGKSVTSSSSYEMPGEGWQNGFLVDGKLGHQGTNGWTTAPADNVTDPYTPAWVQIDLGRPYKVGRIVLFPRSDGGASYAESFPVDFTVEVAQTAGSWTKVYEIKGFAKPTEPLVIDTDPDLVCRYVKLDVTRRTGDDNTTGGGHANDGKLVQLAELAVFGSPETDYVALDRPGLELTVGMSDTLTATVEGNSAVEWTVDDDEVATVEGGQVTAVGLGKTVVRAKVGSAEATADIYVVDKKFDFDDNILISAFWAPTLKYLGSDETRWDEQYRLMAEGGIDYVNNVTSGDLTLKETNLKMAEYAYKYGMRLSVAESRFGQNLLSMNAGQITSLVNEYKNVPGVAGYYIWDEPAPTANLASYNAVYEAIKKADPQSYAHLNFLPAWAYPAQGDKTYIDVCKDAMRTWLRLNEYSGYPQDYLMYDYYPYDLTDGMNRDIFFPNLEAVREVGLEYGVKTASYLQSVCFVGQYRSPLVSEIRYQAMVSLAYGFKQLSYFTWFTPGVRPDGTFEDGVVSSNGVPNPKTYDGVTQLNSEIHALGKTLVNLDSTAVYHNGTQWASTKPVPACFPAIPEDSASYAVSLMRDRNTGRNYVMFVNNDYRNATSFDVRFRSEIKTLGEVSHDNGAILPVTVPAGGKLHIQLEAGDAVLYALPEGQDYVVSDTDVPYTQGANLALNKPIRVTSSRQDASYSAAYVNDGRTDRGWKSLEGENQHVTVDLGDIFYVDNVKITAPAAVNLNVSADGITWVKGDLLESDGAYVFYSPDAFVPVRYVRVSGSGSTAEVYEIEFYGTPAVDIDEVDEFVASVRSSLGAVLSAGVSADNMKELLEVYEDIQNATHNTVKRLMLAAATEMETSLSVDTTEALEALRRVEEAADRLAGRDTADLDDAVAALRQAIEEGGVNQNILDDLTYNVNYLLDKALSSKPSGGGNGGSCSGAMGAVLPALSLVLACAAFVSKRRNIR